MVKDDIKDRLEEYLNNKGINTRKNFKCLVCGGGDKTPPMAYKDNMVKCFSCGFTGDIYDLIGAEYGLTEFKDQLDKAKEIFYIYEPEELKQQGNQIKVTNADKPIKQNTNNPGPKNYQDYILSCHGKVGETDYFIKRGLTKNTIDKFKLGYDPKARAAIIPVSKTYYISRSIEGKQYLNLKNTPSQIFNSHYLRKHNNRPIFITEGAMDALSIEEVGSQAIGLNGTSNISKLLDKLKSIEDKPILIISLDNDGPGEDAALKLEDGLNKLNIPNIKANASGSHKDPNEALIANKLIFKKTIQDIGDHAILEIEAEKEAIRQEYYKNNAAAYIESFKEGVTERVNTPAISTGFNNLDNLLDGGLYEGLYIIGAISSLGKTTFVLQIADQMAQLNHDILIFSLEMARTELMAKSISRLTLLNTTNTRHAKTTRGITEGKRYFKYSMEERALINKAIADYGTYAQNIYISEGIGTIGVMEIKAAVENHISITGKTPIVIVDYLQILAPADVRATDKQNTDIAVLELKRLSRDYKTPVIGISSLNRSNYNTEINMAAFKESGAIEYSSDVLIGLQYLGQGKEFDIEEAANKNPREIELKILKNRNGGRGKAQFQYYPLFNYFKEVESQNSNYGTRQRGNRK